MKNSIRFIFISLFTVFFVCNGAATEYRSIPFNRELVGKPHSMLYITNQSFAIAGNGGLEIQRGKEKNLDTFRKSFQNFKLSKDDATVAAFNQKGIIIANFDNETNFTTIPMPENWIIDVALDSSQKKSIFIGYDSASKSGIRQYYYNNTNSYQDFKFNNDASCVSLALSPKKDMLCVLDNYSEITLRKTDNLAVVFKNIKLSTLDPYNVCMFSPDGDHVVMSGQQSIDIVNIVNDRIYLKRVPWHSNPQAVIRKIAFHPCGLLVILLSHRSTGSVIRYWDTKLSKDVDTTMFAKMRAQNFCFGNNGLELAIVTDDDCIAVSIPPHIMNEYILQPLWMKFKMVQEQCGLSRDILVHCMNVFTAHCGKTA